MSWRHRGRRGEIEVMPLLESRDPPQSQGWSRHEIQLESLLDELFEDQGEGTTLPDEMLLKTATRPDVSSPHDEEKHFALRELLDLDLLRIHANEVEPLPVRPPKEKLPPNPGRSRR